MPRYRTLIIAGLILLTAATAGCKRTATEGSSPLGPSTFVLTFGLTASPNVLMATGQRPTSVITATVTENNQPAAGRTVIFTIIDGPGEFANYLKRIRDNHRLERRRDGHFYRADEIRNQRRRHGDHHGPTPDFNPPGHRQARRADDSLQLVIASCRATVQGSPASFNPSAKSAVIASARSARSSS